MEALRADAALTENSEGKTDWNVEMRMLPQITVIQIGRRRAQLPQRRAPFTN